MDWYWPTWWVLWAAGVLPAVYFVLTWRPRQRWALHTVDASGWVLVLLLLYVRAGAITALTNVQQPTGATATSALASSGAVAVVIWVRALQWARFRRQMRAAS